MHLATDTDNQMLTQKEVHAHYLESYLDLCRGGWNLGYHPKYTKPNLVEVSKGMQHSLLLNTALGQEYGS
jgi:hypothetical protein